MQDRILKLAGASVVLAALVAGCSAPDTNSSNTNYAGYPRISNLVAGQVEVCKFTVGPVDLTPLNSPQTSGYMTVVANPSGTTILDNVLVTSINAATTSQYCSDPVSMPAGTTSLTVTETPSSGSALRFYRYSEDGVMVFNPANPGNYEFYVPGGPTPNTYTFSVDASPSHYYTVYMKNTTYTPEQSGCTLTLGYWQTHSEKGPAPYNSTWATRASGADTPFYLSGSTWLGVMQAAPAGNAYYQLAQQYVAAWLNKAAGASVPSNVQSALDEATTLFQTYTPAQIGALKGGSTLRQQFVSLAGALGSYNEGTTGPGHCD